MFTTPKNFNFHKNLSVKNATHRIFINSTEGEDRYKCLSLNCDLSLKELYNEIKIFFEKLEDYKDNIKINVIHKRPISHTLIIKDLKINKTKSLNINFHDYSSDEILIELKKYYCGFKDEKE